jgi:hypothetical protein
VIRPAVAHDRGTLNREVTSNFQSHTSRAYGFIYFRLSTVRNKLHLAAHVAQKMFSREARLSAAKHCHSTLSVHNILRLAAKRA